MPLAYPVIIKIRHIDIAAGVDTNAQRSIKISLAGAGWWRSARLPAWIAASDPAYDIARAVPFVYPVIKLISYINIAGAVDKNAKGVLK